MQDFPVNFRTPAPGNYEDNRMMMTPAQQLEKMYPEIYYMVNPAVVRQCDMLDQTKGPAYIPTKDEMERMIDQVENEVGGSVNTDTPVQAIRYPEGDPPLGSRGGNPLLRGLIGTLLVGELLGRRGYRPYRRYPGFYPGYYPIVYPGFYPGFYPGVYPGLFY